jgi:hypothetical protein
VRLSAPTASPIRSVPEAGTYAATRENNNQQAASKGRGNAMMEVVEGVLKIKRLLFGSRGSPDGGSGRGSDQAPTAQHINS